METNWQQIEEGELTHSSEHHLMAIHYLREEFGYARITDISNFLNITRGSVSITMNKLNEGKFITFDTNKHITLSPKGEKIVNGILNRRNVLKQFFSNVLMLKEEDAEKNSCKLEHVISDDKIIKRLEKLTNFSKSEKILDELNKLF